MKKMLAVLFSICFASALTLPTFAAGIDDGSLSVAEKDGKKFIGTEIDEGLTKYLSADGSGEAFYDANGDRTMDVCDLVAVTKNLTDLDQNGSYGPEDAAVIRLILIGKN